VVEDRNTVVRHVVQDSRKVCPLVRYEPEHIVQSLLAAAVLVSNQLWLTRMLLVFLIIVDISEGDRVKSTLTL